MFTFRRFDKLYEKSDRFHIDDHDQIVFMSDLHRGDNSLSDEFGQNRLLYDHSLQYYYNNGYTYVEIGDGDELWEVSDYRYIVRAHPAVFERLGMFHRQDRLIMISGNHNGQIIKPGYVKKYMEHAYDGFLGEEVEIFPGIHPVEAVVFVYDPTGQEIFVTHGHQGEIMSDYLSGVSLLTNRYIWRFIHKAGFQYTANPTKNRYKRNRREKVYRKWLNGNNLMLICGHTHRPRMSRPGESPYFNTGCAIHPRGITCIELNFGELALVSWTLQTRRDGMLYVKRNVMKNAVRLEDFMGKRHGRKRP